jgi:hypothetical protein
VKTYSLFFIAALILAGHAPAQTQILRGKVEDVSHTQDEFFLDGTNIPLISSRFELDDFVGEQRVMQVINVGTDTDPVLDIVELGSAAKIFDMGNLKLGRTGTWEVMAPTGSLAVIYVNFTDQTSYLPFGPAGTWLIGLSAVPFAAGTTDEDGQFEFRFTMPILPGLVGTSFTAQALVKTDGVYSISNPDSREVRSE